MSNTLAFYGPILLLFSFLWKRDSNVSVCDDSQQADSMTLHCCDRQCPLALFVTNYALS